MTLIQKAFENIAGKEFSTLSKTKIIILPTVNLLPANDFYLVKAKILCFGKDY